MQISNVLNEIFSFADLDGKVFDAYVAYPQQYAFGFREEVEKFALQTLPQVLEKACGYKLFIAGRDCLPGQCKDKKKTLINKMFSSS